MQCLNSFIHVTIYGASYMPGTILGAGDTIANKSEKVLALTEFVSKRG